MAQLRPIRIEGDIAYITLTQGKVAIIDASDAEEVGQYNWCFDGSYASHTGHCHKVFLHRFIVKPPDDKDVDHIDNNKLDCRKKNMRICTRSQNIMNTGKRSNNTSGVKGVSWHEFNKKWRVQIKVNYKEIYLGYYDDIKIAAQAYREAAIKYHGEFAYLKEES